VRIEPLGGGPVIMENPVPPARRPLLRRLRERFTTPVGVYVDRESDTILHCTARFQCRDVPLGRIVRIEAGNRDNVEHERVFLFFHIDGEATLVVSELEPGFARLVADLQARFPGIETWQRAVPPVAFQLTSVDLWTRPLPHMAG